ncbi:MAG: HAD-IC family P-type ATPase, partial [Oscillospiraceae bacterium]
MEVARLEPLGGRDLDDTEKALARLVYAVGDQNPTAAAVMARYPEVAGDGGKIVPFSSARKWSGGTFSAAGTWVLGAGEFVLGAQFEDLREKIERASAEGERVLVLAHSESDFGAENALPQGLSPAALLYLTDKIRPSARDTLQYFADQGVTLKVISGDNAVTVSAVAKRAGLRGAERYVDATTLDTDEKLAAAAEAYTVFGRVTPRQKLLLVQALKAEGHTVAMTGDGVNDVMALKESDCSVAMASGSDAARAVSQIVLLDSDFASMPHIVMEGRRAINNLQRSAALFLTKTVFSTILAVFFIFLAGRYPFQPIQLTLISVLTIGVPSFLLALEPNRERVEGAFLRNVLSRSLPGALTMVSSVLLLVAISVGAGFTPEEISTLAVLVTGFTGLSILWNVCRPFTPFHRVLFAAMCVGFVGATTLFPGFFSLTGLTWGMAAALLVLMAWATAVLVLLRRWMAPKRRAGRGGHGGKPS